MKKYPALKFNSQFFIFFVLILSLGNLQAQSIPPDLQPWKSWVEYEQEFHDCPFFYNQNNRSKSSHVCAWPQQLQLQIKDNKGSFKINWEVLQDSWVDLPGDQNSWPTNVLVNQKPQMVQRQQNRPRLFLQKGEYQVSGEFDWSKRPETINVPEEIADVRLTLDDTSIVFPQRRGQSLWLGENKTEQKQEANNVEFDVNRLIIDGHPMTMYVLLDVSVSGSARSENLGRIETDQFQVTSVDGDLSVYVDKDGFLWAQLKPGSWQIQLSFNVINWPSEIVFEPGSEMWPKQEIWAYQDDKNIRITQIEGVQPINPEQSFSEWDEVPNYLVNAGDTFQVVEQKRGTLNQTAQLELYRTLWLSFDGDSVTSSDEIIGDKLGSWRLDADPGYELLNARSHDENMLITQSESGDQGLELRTPDIDLNINAEFAPQMLKDINPWKANFNQIETTMYLPYGYFPLLTSNVDNTHGFWLEKWKLWDIFIVMLITVFCFKVIGLYTSIIAFLTLVLGYHESNMPLIAWINLIVGVALLSFNPSGKLLKLIRSYVVLSVLGLLMNLVPFLINQVRLSIHPQLETSLNSTQHSYSSVKMAKKEARDNSRYEELSRKNSQTYNSMNAMAPVQSQAMDSFEEDRVELERVVTTGSSIKNVDLVNRYQTGAILQAGKATPQWRTRAVQMNWDGPISQEQKFNLVILPPVVRMLWRLLLVAASVLWLVFLIKRLTYGSFSLKKSAAAMVFLLLAVPTLSAAQSFPSETLLNELKSRSYPQADCSGNCAAMDQVEVRVTDNMMVVDISYHSFENVVVNIPYSSDWKIEQTRINGEISASKLWQGNQLWIPLPKGINQVRLSGPIANRNNISVHFPGTPGSIKASASGWQIAGIEGKLLVNNTLQLISTNQESSDSEETNSTDIQPFVMVHRYLTFDDNWYVRTQVNRVAPVQGAINLSIPKLQEENPTKKLQYDDKGQVIVSLGPTEYSFGWQSRLDKMDEITLHAAENESYLEVWEVLSSPQWNVSLSGVPIITPLNIVDKMDDYFVHTYKPRPGESLTVKVSRPEPKEGDIVSIESIKNTYSVGKRATKTLTEIQYRATQGGSFDIQLDENAVVNSVSYDGVDSNLTNEEGLISVGFLPGSHKVVIDWQVDKEFSTLNTTPTLSLDTQYTNIYQSVRIAKNRWVLYGTSEGVGPAFLYWGEFLFFTVLAFFLARLPFSLLKFWQWLALGYAFGTVSWFAFGFIAIWLFFVGWKKQHPPGEKNFSSIALQWFTVAFTLVTLVVFICSVAFGLLSYPQMGIMGQSSSASHLHWFLDVYQNQLPTITVISLPIWWYKALMLIWSIWISFSLVEWLKQLFKSLEKNHWWGRNKIKTNDGK